MVPKFSLKSSHIEIQIFQWTSNRVMIKTKVVDLTEIINYNLFILNHLSKKNYI